MGLSSDVSILIGPIYVSLSNLCQNMGQKRAKKLLLNSCYRLFWIRSSCGSPISSGTVLERSNQNKLALRLLCVLATDTLTKTTLTHSKTHLKHPTTNLSPNFLSQLRCSNRIAFRLRSGLESRQLFVFVFLFYYAQI